MEQYTYWIVTTILGLMIGALGWLIKKLIGDLETKIARSEASTSKRLEQLEKRVDKGDERFDALIKDLPQKYAYRDDLIRMSQTIEARLDRIQDILLDIKGGNH